MRSAERAGCRTPAAVACHNPQRTIQSERSGADRAVRAGSAGNLVKAVKSSSPTGPTIRCIDAPAVALAAVRRVCSCLNEKIFGPVDARSVRPPWCVLR
jgi:hypothetical protein